MKAPEAAPPAPFQHGDVFCCVKANQKTPVTEHHSTQDNPAYDTIDLVLDSGLDDLPGAFTSLPSTAPYSQSAPGTSTPPHTSAHNPATATHLKRLREP